MLEEYPGPVLRTSTTLRVQYVNRAARASCAEWELMPGRKLPPPLQPEAQQAMATSDQRTVDLSCGDRLYTVTFMPVPAGLHIFGWEIPSGDASVESLRAHVREEDREVAELEERVRVRTAELQRRADQLARLTSELTLAEQRERRRLAKLLHDHLQQLLVGAKFGLQVLSNQVDDAHIQSVLEVKELIDESIAASRSLTMELSPPILHEAGLAAGLQWLARWMKDKHDLKVRLAINPSARTEREDVRVLVFEAVRELLFNVAKHSGVNQTSLEFEFRDEDTLVVTVSDEGVGFDLEEIVDQKEPFGFGLLSIRERLGHLGGAMEIESSVGAGTRVTVSAPVRVQSAVATAPDMQAAGGSSSPDRNDDRIAVLLVDDHAVLRQGLKLLISEEEDMEVVGEAANGEEAVERVRNLLPDVVLMDFSMPKLDGASATRIITSERPDVRVIGLSMYEEADRADAMIEAGAVAYFCKSGDPGALLAAIRENGTGRKQSIP